MKSGIYHLSARSKTVLAGLLAVASTTVTWAQAGDPTLIYRRPDPPALKSEVKITTRWMMAPDVTFSGLGSVTGPSIEDRTTDGTSVIDGTERLIRYDDGQVGQDYEAIELIAGSGQTSFIPIQDGATSRFGLTSNDQLIYGDGGAVTGVAYHTYSSAADPDVVYGASASSGASWEIAYARYFGAKRNLGFEVGFAFSGFDADFSEQITADLIEQEFVHDVVSGEIDLLTPVTDADGAPVLDEYNQPSYTPVVGDRVREDGEPLIDLNPNPDLGSDPVTIEDGALVEQNVDLRSAFYVFRAGTTYELDLSARWAVNLGLGVTATYVDTDFTVEEVLIGPSGASNISTGRLLASDSEWIMGGYVDASASYQFSERVSFFSGLQYLAADDFQSANEQRTADVEFKSQVHVQAGFGIKF